MVAQGDIWWMETPNAKRRPVLIITRNEAIDVLNNIVVAPVTSTIRRIRTTISLGVEDGLRDECVASFDSLATVPKSVLTARIGALGAVRRHEICAALAALADF